MKSYRWLLIFSVALGMATACTRKIAREPHQDPPGKSEPRPTLSPEVLLRKISFHLRGITPTVEEFEALSKVTESERPAFFEAKKKEYLASPNHRGKMVARLDTLFRVRSSGLPPEVTPTPGAISGRANAMDHLFWDIIDQNQSWDHLLTGKQYSVYAGDRRSFQLLVPDADMPKGPDAFPVQFDASDSRIAGAITTPRFLNRYSTTNLNRSRGRAAALFRIFLCDDMRAVVEPKPGEDDELLKRAFPTGVAETFRPLSIEDDRHTRDAACVACHYKLDPLGKTFLTTGGLIGDKASPGALVFKRLDGTLVKVPAQGIGEIAAAIALQPEYSRCQVSHFWKWFVDSDLPAPARMEALVKEFERLDRRPNDFIAYLLAQPEFTEMEAEETGATFASVRPLLDRCTQCHLGLEGNDVPPFTQIPMGGADHEKWVKRIIKRLDLAHDGAKKTMPPKSSAWQPSAEDIARIKNWIAEGVKDESGKATVDPVEAQKWVKP